MRVFFPPGPFVREVGEVMGMVMVSWWMLGTMTAMMAVAPLVQIINGTYDIRVLR